MKNKEDAAKLLLEHGWTLEEVVNVLDARANPKPLEKQFPELNDWPHTQPFPFSPLPVPCRTPYIAPFPNPLKQRWQPPVEVT